MSQYDNNMRGTLGKNERREKDTHPEYTGRCEIDGQEYWISAWIKESAKGKFFSLSFKPKEERQASTNAPKASQRKQRVDDDESVPF
mgnify:CR=1 FL=1